jgi:hypothetical protein
MQREWYHEPEDLIRSCGLIGSQKLFAPISLIDKDRSQDGNSILQQPVM